MSDSANDLNATAITDPKTPQLPLNNDLLDLIFLLTPSFTDLLNLIVTCQSFSRVFKSRPQSILQRVALNMLGDLFPYALRAVRGGPDLGHLGWGSSELEIRRKEAKGLQKNANTVAKYEEIFSLRWVL
jgi:hypothetical protein